MTRADARRGAGRAAGAGGDGAARGAPARDPGPPALRPQPSPSHLGGRGPGALSARPQISRQRRPCAPSPASRRLTKSAAAASRSRPAPAHAPRHFRSPTRSTCKVISVRPESRRPRGPGPPRARRPPSESQTTSEGCGTRRLPPARVPPRPPVPSGRLAPTPPGPRRPLPRAPQQRSGCPAPLPAAPWGEQSRRREPDPGAPRASPWW